VNEKSRIMLIRNKSSNSDNQGEALKPSMRGLLEVIERMMKMTHMALKNKV
jgi:hypothetical protein